jgi:hypothetical protein
VLPNTRDKSADATAIDCPAVMAWAGAGVGRDINRVIQNTALADTSAQTANDRRRMIMRRLSSTDFGHAPFAP